jgi:CSLREA domain-containing protein
MFHPLHRRYSTLVLMLLFALGLALPAAPPAYAIGALTVTTLADNTDPNDGKCSLREALQAAFNEATYQNCVGAGTSPNVITFGIPGVIKLTMGALTGIHNNVGLVGPITIDGNGSDRILNVSASGTLSLGLVTLMNGKVSGGGGAILSAGGTINIAGSSFIGNQADNNGGVIDSTGSINIVGSNFSGNKATGNGGAINISGGDVSLTLAGSNFAGNIATGSGGAISVSADADISDVIFSGNIATGDATKGGGAIFNSAASGGSKLTLIRSSFNGNLSPQGSGGALFNGTQATAVVSDSSFNGNIAGTPIANNRFGGAIYNQSQAQLALNRVTMLTNAVGGSGGALANDKGTAIVTNTSFTANAASSKGGGVFNFDSQQGGANISTVTLRNVTFSSNAALISGGGIYNDSANNPFAVVTISNTIVDNSDGVGFGGNCVGTITSSGHNLDGGASCALNQPGDLSSADPKLDIPFFNGGPLVSLLTQKLKFGSAAIDAGDPAICAADPVLNQDQRGKPRPNDGDGNGNEICDIGAFEADTIVAGYGSTPVQPGPIVVGSSIVGQGPINTTFNVFDTGTGALKVNTPKLVGLNASDFTVDPNLSLTINPDDPPQAITVGCTPGALGNRVATLILTTNDPANTNVTYNLICTGTAAPAPAFGSTPAAPGPVSIGNVLLGGTGSTTIVLKNIGNAPLTVNSLALGSVNPADFSIPANFSATIAGGATQDLTISCAPLALGIRTATLTLSTNDSNKATVLFNLTCTGTTLPPPVLVVGGSIPTIPPSGSSSKAYGVVTSPDGKFVYVRNMGGAGIRVFSRDLLTGDLTPATPPFVANADLAGAGTIIMSPDGQNLYATGMNAPALSGFQPGAVVAFSRDATTGGLTLLSTVKQGTNYGFLFCPCPTVQGLSGAYGLALSPDGGYLYITGVNSDSLTVLSRNLVSGSLNDSLTLRPNVVQETLSSANLNGAYGVTLSPDGKNIYVANYGDYSLTAFARDGSTGKFTITPADRKVQGQAGVDGISGVFRVIISSDGAYVYTAAFFGDSVAVFQRDPATGALNYLARYANGSDGVTGLGTGTSLVLSPDGQHLYATAYGNGADGKALVIFDRDSGTGLLTFNSRIQRNPFSGGSPSAALDGARDVAVSPDGDSVYISAYNDDAIVTLKVPNPTPVIESIRPASQAAGSPAFTLYVIGTGFMPTSVVQWNGSARPTTYDSSTKLRADISAADLTTAGPFPQLVPITVVNPVPGGGTSNIVNFTITGPNQNPVPAIERINPLAAPAGGPSFTLLVAGSNYLPSSVVQWNGSPRMTTYVSQGTLKANIPATDIAQPGVAGVTVLNPGPGGGVSNAKEFTITGPGDNPTPSITRIDPPSVTGTGATAASFTLLLVGDNYTTDSQVQWNGSSRPTTYVSNTQLKAIISAVDIATPGKADVTVVNPVPGGGASNIATFTISIIGDNPLPVLRSLAVNPSNGLGITLIGINFINGATIQWNGVTRQPTAVDGTQVSFSITSNEFKTPAIITVTNPGPGGGASNELLFDPKLIFLPLLFR